MEREKNREKIEHERMKRMLKENNIESVVVAMVREKNVLPSNQYQKIATE